MAIIVISVNEIEHRHFGGLPPGCDGSSWSVRTEFEQSGDLAESGTFQLDATSVAPSSGLRPTSPSDFEGEGPCAASKLGSAEM